MFKSVAASISTPLLIAASLAGQTLTVRSGNGPVGGTDSSIHFLLGPTTGGFNHTFTSTDFASAQSGPSAYILSQTPFYISGLPTDPSAHWIGTNPNAGSVSGNSALYAASFQITSAFASATMALNYSVDDGIGASGDPLNSGVYLNGTAICGNSFPTGFSQAHTVNCSQIGAQLQVGTNWLYIEDVNAVVSPAGLLFSATISTLPTPTTTPGTNLITNGSFEAPLVPSGGYLNYPSGSTSITGWTVVGAAGGVSIISGTFAWECCTFPAEDGSQWLDLTGDNINSVEGVEQTVATAAGTQYVLSFWVGNTYDPGGGFGTTSTVDVRLGGLNGTLLGAFTNSSTTMGTQVWQKFTTMFTATGSSTTLDFLNADPSNDNNNGLDNVVLVATGPPTPTNFTYVPIPGTNNIQTHLMNTFPTGTFIANNALATPFNISTAPGNCGPSGSAPCNYYDGFGSSGSGLSIRLNVSVPSPTDVYTLMNAYSPAAGEQLATITFLGTGGASMIFPLIGGQDIRDYNMDGFANSLSNGVAGVEAVNAFTCTAPTTCQNDSGAASTFLIDEQHFFLASTFAGQMLTQIVLTDTYNGSSPILLGVTVGAPSQAPAPQPSITGLSPTSAQVGSGPLTLTINGSGFTAASSVTFNGISHSVSFINSSQLTITLTASDVAAAGSFAVIVTNPSPGGGTSNTFNFTVSPAVPTITSVKNSASILPGPISPGEIVSIYGTDIGPTTPAVFQLDSSGNMPTSISGVQVLFNGTLAPLFYVSSTQINAVVPYEAAGIPNPTVTVLFSGNSSNVFALTPAAATPGIFTLNEGGTGPGAILDVQYNPVISTNPTMVGAAILIFCTGLGPVTNQPPTGALALSNPLSWTTTVPVVTIGGATAQVLFSGLAPGNDGLNQVNVVVPTGSVTGPTVPITISIDGATSNVATVAIQPFPNPQPSLTNLSPSSAQAGSGPLTLTINGTGFIPTSAVTFNGSSHAISFVNANQLTVTLSASDLSVSGNFPVVVINPPPGGGASNAINFTVSPAPNPKPSITALSPASAQDGSAPVTLTINGTGFLSSSTVTFNSLSHAPMFVGGSQLTITLSAADLATAGSFPVIVTNPPPGGGSSNAFSFTITPAPISLTGNWQGAWESGVYLFTSGTLSANLTQSGTTLAGTVSFLGSPCALGGSISGTLNGSTLSASVAASGGQTVSLNATVNALGSAINGNYTLRGGTCAPSGDSGTFSLTKSP